MSKLVEAQTAYTDFMASCQSAMLATANPEGLPNASYAPFVTDEERNIYMFVSGLSTHTQNLTVNPRASVMFIEDEASSQQIFARRRLTFDCTARLVDREDAAWEAIAARFQERFGDIIDLFRQLPDFRIFQLTPSSGRFVIGFGAAYDVDPNDFTSLMQVTGNGKGHGSA